MPTRAAAQQGSSPHRIAVLCGSDQAADTEWRREVPVDVTGNNDVYRLIDTERFYWRRFHLAPGYFSQGRRWDLGSYGLVFNIVSEADTNTRTLAVIERITANLRTPVVNSPASVRMSTREAMAQRLRGIPEALVPRVMRVRRPTVDQLRAMVQANDIRFPLIVRPTGTHTGRVVGLFERPEDCDGAFAGIQQDLILIEYVDARRADGLYPKIRFFFIGDTILVRHLFLGTQWNVHGVDYGRVVLGDPRLEAEEEQLLRGGFAALPPPAQTALRKIRKRIDLDYFGLDGAILPDGRLLTFEVNATMNFFPLSFKGHGLYKHEVCLPPAQDAVTRLILTKAGSPSSTS